MIPNSVRTVAHRPEIARAFIKLNIAVMTNYGAVTLEFKRLIGYLSSFASGCMYCQAHMILVSERFGATAVPNAVDEAVSARLRRHWPGEAVVEIRAVVSLFGNLNRWNDSMGSLLEVLPRSKSEERLGDTGWRVGRHA